MAAVNNDNFESLMTGLFEDITNVSDDEIQKLENEPFEFLTAQLVDYLDSVIRIMEDKKLDELTTQFNIVSQYRDFNIKPVMKILQEKARLDIPENTCFADPNYIFRELVDVMKTNNDPSVNRMAKYIAKTDEIEKRTIKMQEQAQNKEEDIAVLRIRAARQIAQ